MSGLGEAVFVTARSAELEPAALTVVVAVAELLLRSESPELVVAEAVLEIVPALLGVTVMVTVARRAAAIVPSEPVTTPPVWLTEPWLDVADT